MNAQIIELLIFICTFLIPILLMFPIKNSLLVYDQGHFYKYKYIIGVIYDLIGIILIPTGLTALNDSFKNRLSLILFIICIIIFVIVAVFRYQIEKEYDNLSRGKIKNKTYYNFKRSFGQVILYLYLSYFIMIPINILSDIVLKERQTSLKGDISVLFIYLLIVIMISIVMSYEVVTIQLNKILNIINSNSKKRFLLYFLFFVICDFYIYRLDLHINLLSKIIIEIVILFSSILLINLKPLLKFRVIIDRKWKRIGKDVIGVYDLTRINFNVEKNNESSVIKYVGSLSLFQLIQVRLKKNLYISIDNENIVKNVDQGDHSYFFTVRVDKLNINNNRKINYVTFVNEDNYIFYQPMILLK